MDGEIEYKTCKRGHLKTPDNTYYYGRMCKECMRITKSAWRKKNRGKMNAENSLYHKRHPEKQKERNAKNIIEVSRKYVARILKIRTCEMPEELYELKREQILLFRARQSLNKTIRELSE